MRAGLFRSGRAWVSGAALAWSLGLWALGVPVAAEAFCPSYTASSSANTHSCAIEAAPGTNPTPAEWQAIFALVAQGPDGWGAQGPTVGMIGQGCGKPTPTQQVSARFPCELLKAIAMQESGWRQFCVPDRPTDQVGGASRTIISFDCGYGIGQVTSGMHVGESPSFDRARVANDATYNLATGTRILAEKWRITNCVGDNQPSIIEHWYTAAWAYNGLAYVNNPTNPAYDADRGVWNPSVGGGAPYQEKVFGWMERPPSASHWGSVALAYPALGEVGGGGSPPALTEPSCASPTDCGNKRTVHASSCFPDAAKPDAGTPVDPEPEPTADGGSTEKPDPGPGPVLPGVDGGSLGELPEKGFDRLVDGSGVCGCTSGAGPALLVGLLALVGAAARRRRQHR